MLEQLLSVIMLTLHIAHGATQVRKVGVGTLESDVGMGERASARRGCRERGTETYVSTTRESLENVSGIGKCFGWKMTKIGSSNQIRTVANRE